MQTWLRLTIHRVHPGDVSAWLAQHDWSPETRKDARGALASYYRWAVRHGHTATNPVDGTDPVRVPSTVPKPIPEDVLQATLKTDLDDGTRLMILLGAYAGMRRAEIANCRWEHFTSSDVRIHGKGGRVRTVPLHPLIVPHIVGDKGPVFGLDPSQVARRIRRATGGWGPHTLRHRFATQLYGSGNDLLRTQRALGHSSPATTQRYVALPDDVLADAVRSLP